MLNLGELLVSRGLVPPEELERVRREEQEFKSYTRLVKPFRYGTTTTVVVHESDVKQLSAKYAQEFNRMLRETRFRLAQRRAGGELVFRWVSPREAAKEGL